MTMAGYARTHAAELEPGGVWGTCATALVPRFSARASERGRGFNGMYWCNLGFAVCACVRACGCEGGQVPSGRNMAILWCPWCWAGLIWGWYFRWGAIGWVWLDMGYGGGRVVYPHATTDFTRARVWRRRSCREYLLSCYQRDGGACGTQLDRVQLANMKHTHECNTRHQWPKELFMLHPLQSIYIHSARPMQEIYQEEKKHPRC